MTLLRRLTFMLPAVLVLLVSAPHGKAEAVSLPAEVELPVRVRIAVRVLHLVKVEEIAGQARLLVEMTQRWHDPRQSFDPLQQGSGRIDRVGADAESYLRSIWTPGTEIENRVGDPEGRAVATSTYATGEVVVIERYEGRFRFAINLDAFPFDRQDLSLTFFLPRYSAQEVLLVSTEADREMSLIKDVERSPTWRPLRLRFANQEAVGWNARPHSKLHATMTIARESPPYILRIFVPIAAVIAVSVFALWCPGMTAKDKGNIIFSSLLALAAISFTFEASFPGSISLNTPVAQIISLGYLYLVMVLMADVAIEWASSREGPHRSAWLELRRHVRWALPAMMLLVSIGAAVRSIAA